MKNNKVLMINTSVSDGGAAKIVERLRSELSAKSIDTSLWVKKKLVEASDVFELRQKSRLMLRLSQLFRRDDVELFLNDLIHRFRASDVDGFDNAALFNSKEYLESGVVHCHNLHGMFFNLDNLMRMSREEKRLVWTLHDMWPITGHCAHSFDCEKWMGGCNGCPYLNTYQSLLWDNSREMRNAKKDVYERVKMTVVAPSQWLLSKVEESILRNQKTVLIPNGVDEMKFVPRDRVEIKKELGIDPKKKVILFVAQGGVENVWKGGEFLKKLFKENINKDWLWMVVGGNRNLKLGNYWELKYIADEEIKAKYFAAADVFVYPTLADNCPLVVLEAMSCGVPVVTFEVGGLPELVVHNETGYVAKYKDYTDLRNGLTQLLSDKHAREKMGQNARWVVEKKYTLKKMVDSYIDLYQS